MEKRRQGSCYRSTDKKSRWDVRNLSNRPSWRTYTCKIGSDGCLANFNTSDTVSDNASGGLSMNCQTRSTRHTIALWKKSGSKTGNTHTDSFSVSQQLPAHFASRSSRSSSHSISTQIQHPHSVGIGVRRTQHTLCDPHVPVCLRLSTWMDRRLSNLRIFR